MSEKLRRHTVNRCNFSIPRSSTILFFLSQSRFTPFICLPTGSKLIYPFSVNRSDIYLPELWPYLGTDFEDLKERQITLKEPKSSNTLWNYLYWGNNQRGTIETLIWAYEVTKVKLHEPVLIFTRTLAIVFLGLLTPMVDSRWCVWCVSVFLDRKHVKETKNLLLEFFIIKKHKMTN